MMNAAPSSLSGQDVVVVGLGRSGVAAASLCARHGARVVATDSRPLMELSEQARALDATLLVGGHEEVKFNEADRIVISPGVPSLEPIESARAQGVSVIGELELAWSFCSAPVLAGGGTNGKSTVTTLLAEMLAAEFGAVFSGGNLGVPLSEVVEETWDALVLEVSSFQLERAPTFRPAIGVLLNISEDHLDRYDSFEHYAAAKGNAFVNQAGDDTAVLPAGDALCEQQCARGAGKRSYFGNTTASQADYQVADDRLLERSTGHLIDLREVRLFGEHNRLNIAATVAAARAFGTSWQSIEEVLGSFEGLPHRMQWIRCAEGVDYYDDSKATNVDAALCAVQGVKAKRVVLIAGGRDKGGSYAPLAAALASRAGAVIVIGEAAGRIAAAMPDGVELRRAATLADAVLTAAAMATRGDAVLLSPACSSFDQYRSYGERGDDFQQAVQRLTDGVTR